jgi:hypothetical protein
MGVTHRLNSLKRKHRSKKREINLIEKKREREKERKREREKERKREREKLLF